MLTVGDIGQANLDASIRSFFRHVSGVQNENMHDAEKEKKRKRGTVTSNSRSSLPENGLAYHESPHKMFRNSDGSREEVNDVANKSLPKSIESLYESILSAQKELEAGRNWNAERNVKLN